MGVEEIVISAALRAFSVVASTNIARIENSLNGFKSEIKSDLLRHQ